MRNFKPAAQKSKPTNGANNVTNNNTAGVISNNNNPGGDNQNPTGNSSAPSRLYRDEGGGSTQSLKVSTIHAQGTIFFHQAIITQLTLARYGHSIGQVCSLLHHDNTAFLHR